MGYTNAAGATTRKVIVVPMFKNVLPVPLSWLQFTEIALGTQPINLDIFDVRSHHGGAFTIDVGVIRNDNSDTQMAAKYIG